jgi:hypothetical protein
MDESVFEGTLVLERLAEVGEVEAFYDAIDSDDTQRALRIMKIAGVDQATIDHVLELISDSDGQQ